MNVTVDEERKLVPVIFRVWELVPTGMEVGDREVTVGTGFGRALTVKFTAEEAPPPGAALVTITG